MPKILDMVSERRRAAREALLKATKKMQEDKQFRQEYGAPEDRKYREVHVFGDEKAGGQEVPGSRVTHHGPYDTMDRWTRAPEKKKPTMQSKKPTMQSASPGMAPPAHLGKKE
jgi:hypothetical protein